MRSPTLFLSIAVFICSCAVTNAALITVTRAEVVIGEDTKIVLTMSGPYAGAMPPIKDFDVQIDDSKATISVVTASSDDTTPSTLTLDLLSAVEHGQNVTVKYKDTGCTDARPDYCQREVGTFLGKITKCKQDSFFEDCELSCGYCDPLMESFALVAAVHCATTQVDNSDLSTADSITGVFGGTPVSVTCDSGYTGTGHATCQINGTFSTVTCTRYLGETLTQGVRISSLDTSTYEGDVKKGYEIGFAKAYNLTTTNADGGAIEYVNGVRVNSTAAARRSATVTFVVTITNEFIGTPFTKSSIANAGSIASAIESVKHANNLTLDVPDETDITPQTTRVFTSGGLITTDTSDAALITAEAPEGLPFITVPAEVVVDGEATKIVLTISRPLHIATPPIKDFDVQIDGSNATISGASASSDDTTPSTLTLDLSSAVEPGQNVTVKYKYTGCTDARPDYCQREVGTILGKITKCEQKYFIENCELSCSYCDDFLESFAASLQAGRRGATTGFELVATVPCAFCEFGGGTLTQGVRISSLNTSTYKGAVKKGYEISFALANKLTTTNADGFAIEYANGVRVSSTAAARSAIIIFVVSFSNAFKGPLPTKSSIANAVSIASAIESVRDAFWFYKVQNCPPLDLITDEATCITATTATNNTYKGVTKFDNIRPKGCYVIPEKNLERGGVYWNANSNSSYANPNNYFEGLCKKSSAIESVRDTNHLTLATENEVIKTFWYYKVQNCRPLDLITDEATCKTATTATNNTYKAVTNFDNIRPKGCYVIPEKNLEWKGVYWNANSNSSYANPNNYFKGLCKKSSQ